MLDGDLHVQLGPGLGPARAQMRECDVLLEERRPAAARRVARLLGAGVDRNARAPGGLRQPGGEPDLGVEALESFPADLDADELPLRPARLLGGKGLFADELLL